MKVNLDVRKGKTVGVFYLFFLIHTVQTGAGIMGVPAVVYREAKQSAWISVLIAGIAMHIVVAIMIVILKQYENADIFGIQQDLFGKWVGKFLGILYIGYLMLLFLSVLLNYTEIVRVYIFPKMSTFAISFILISLCVYAVLGGLRVATGVSFIFFFATVWLIFMVYRPATLIHWEHYMPLFESGLSELWLGAIQTGFTVLGFEFLFFLYPYIDNKKWVWLSSQLAVAFTTFLIFIVTFVSIGYFSGDQLETMIWATLAMFKIIKFSVLERFDFVAVGLWLMVILPNLILILWAMTSGGKRLFQFKQKKSVYAFAIIAYIVVNLFEYRMDINMLTDWTAKIGSVIAFIYPVILLPIVLIKKRVQRRKASKGGSP
ncbi:spore germination protein [Pontibacillus halophilus JSM 076056 = DSM 19796]|uniref:Spore germination protein n=1 Tax=Pontibacillus halophilus JSM 076056 = DSM 19796 TaxID=1385510 RepID=A0A0A5GFD2_9BACI|nr:GerAB/ArcD/ProY family transporter [Pontibacillus halophilus]KGX90714.1 spore germination protein [Pontibacillus halophilus JSM 076056 = DSM 19796]